MNRHFCVVTDGSAIGNPGPGGWAAILVCGRQRWEISGAVSWSTISEMELRAAVEALRSIPLGAGVTLYSDSQYLIRGMRYLAARWKDQGWRNRRGMPLQNRELWEELLQLESRLKVRWTWVRGHHGHELQDRADTLAYTAARERLLVLRKAA